MAGRISRQPGPEGPNNVRVEPPRGDLQSRLETKPGRSLRIQVEGRRDLAVRQFT